MLGRLVAALGTVAGAERSVLENDATIPLALPVALLLDGAALVVSPVALGGAFPAPFSRLPFAGKARAMELIEVSLPRLIAPLDTRLPEPFKASLSGLLRYLGGAPHALTAFGCFGEYACLDPITRTLTCRPVGWELTGYLPDNCPGDGWDDLLGYYQGRREAIDA